MKAESILSGDMGLFRILYWGIAYTTGIVCATGFFLIYLRKRDKSALKLLAFLLAFGFSLVCLSIMEAFSGSPVYSSIAGQLALVGASVIPITFPAFALGLDETKRRHRTALALKLAGIALAALNVVAFFAFSNFVASLIQIATFIALGAAIFIGMTWITRGSIKWDGRNRAALMGSLFILFSVMLVLDLFRNFFPPLKIIGWRYIILPGFYAYLNVFLLYAHINLWMDRPEEAPAAEAPGDEKLMERYGISKRELEVLALLARGRTYLEIADGLCVSLATVKSHVTHLLDKTGTRNKVELINLLYDSRAPRPNQPKS
jgi:DNA-binding CsgD family transcriptional regulator